MSKWHVNPNTGNPGRCKADPSNPRGRGCDFQLSENEHFDSALSAARNYEQQGGDDDGLDVHAVFPRNA